MSIEPRCGSRNNRNPGQLEICRGQSLSTIPQTILDRLTDVAMPRLQAERPAKETMAARGFSMPAQRCETLVLGSGAAGLRAAVELKRRDVDVVVASQSAFGGTSACSGSDKQTLHTANGAGRGDDFWAMADALGAGGAMDEDTAYVEAVGSARARITAIHGAANPAGPARRRTALPDGPR